MDLQNPVVTDVLAHVVGANSLDIIEELVTESEMDEFSLAERLGMDVKTVRKILYKLYDHRLVRFRRVKDDETGWYIYIWSFDGEKLNSLVDRVRRDKIKNIRKKLEYERENQFFVCENGCVRVPFENAMEVGFVCPHCGGKLVFFDNSTIIDQLEKQLNEIERTFGI